MSQNAIRIREEIISRASAGPTSFVEIEEQVAGFRVPPGTARSWSYQLGGITVWDGMTRRGLQGLSTAIRSRQIALRPANPLLYLVLGRVVKGDPWIPHILVPASWANFGTADRLVSIPDELLERYSDLVACQTVPNIFPVGS